MRFEGGGVVHVSVNQDATDSVAELGSGVLRDNRTLYRNVSDGYALWVSSTIVKFND